MKKISIILIILVLFLVSCKDSIRYGSGLAVHEETGLYVELLDDGNGQFCICRVGDDKGIFNDKKINTLLPQLQSDLENNLENYEFNAHYIDWYENDPNNLIDAIIGDDGAYINLSIDDLGIDGGSYTYIENTYIENIVFKNTLKFDSSIVNKGAWLFFIEKVDNGDYIDFKASKVITVDLYYGNEIRGDCYEIEPVIIKSYYDKNWDLVTTEEINIIDIVNDDNFDIEEYLNPYNAVAKELEYF